MYKMIPCVSCNGTGRDTEYCYDPSTGEEWQREAECLDCDGEGEIDEYA